MSERVHDIPISIRGSVSGIEFPLPFLSLELRVLREHLEVSVVPINFAS